METTQIAELHARGLSNRQIAAAANMHHKTVSGALGRLGLSANRPGRRKAQELPDGRLVCTKCHQPKPASQFHVQRSGAKYPYRLSYCDDCRRAQVKTATHRSLQSFFGDRVARIRARCVERGLEFGLTADAMVDLFNRQGGLCFYTDEPMSHAAGVSMRRAISFDRVDHAGGYVLGNVVLCSARANTIKNDLTLEELSEWMPKWSARVAMWRRNGVACFQVAPGDF